MRLDRSDSYLRTFTAAVTAVTDGDDGWWVALDRSAFYPTAGGQPHDTGTLSGVAVTDVKSEDDIVWHRVDVSASDPPSPAGSGPLRPGAVVVGIVDWDRRFRHMQRHTGQHLLSQAFIRVGLRRGAGFATTSVSLRGADCTLDLAGEPDHEACVEAEAEANRAARAALPVSAFEVEERHLHEYRLRRPAKVGGLVRLVAIGDYDLVACGGTHVRNSAELLPIAVLGSERVRGGLTRVTFRVGDEAVEDAAAKHAVVARLGAMLSSTAAELPSQVARLQGELTTARAETGAAHALAAGFLAGSAVAAGRTGAGVPIVRVVLRDRQTALFDALVDRFQASEDVVALCAAEVGNGSGEHGPATRVRVAFTAGAATRVDVRPALAAALAVVGGRGGGRPDRAMGAGPLATRVEEALDAAVRVLADDATAP